MQRRTAPLTRPAPMSALLADAPPARTTTDRAFRWTLWLFIGSIAFSVAGTLLLRLFPSTMLVFGPYYPTLVKAPTWTYMILLPILPLLAYARTHPRALLLFFALWGSLIGGMSELVGTSTGFPFGAYSYGAWLGPKLLDHVPYLIPPSWFAMSLLSLDLASRLTPRRYERIAVTAVFMVLWDVSLDPAMSRAFPFWTYPVDGFYFGMPASNWAGWLGVSLVIAWGYEVLGGGLRSTSYWAPILYGLNCLFPLLICALYDLWAALLFGTLALVLPLAALAARGRLREADTPLPSS